MSTKWDRLFYGYLLFGILYCLWLLLSGCGAPPSTSRAGSLIDPAANAEVWAFEQAYGLQVTVSVGFWGDVSALPEADDASVGLCVPADRQVWLDAVYWRQRPECREALVFHELGHCVLDLPHDNSVSSTGRPLSVMHEYLTQVCWAWPRHRAAYVEGLR